MYQDLLQNIQSNGHSIQQRMEAGKQIRKRVPRLILGEYSPAANRPDPVSILEAQAQTRLPELVPIRYARMLASPFAFLRGAAAVMAADLAAEQQSNTTGIRVQCCGDMHVANFGVFASAERNLVFGINDFDETLAGPWEWDLKRLVASIVSSGRFLGASKSQCAEGVRAAVRTYRARMKEYAQMGSLELWYATITEKEIYRAIPESAHKGMKKIASKARTRTHMQVLGKMTDLVDEKYRLKEDAPFIVHETHTKAGRPINEALKLLLDSYLVTVGDDRKKLLSHYKIVDAARKVVGVGSVGTRCWVIFLTGNNADDPLFLQVSACRPAGGAGATTDTGGAGYFLRVGCAGRDPVLCAAVKGYEGRGGV